MQYSAQNTYLSSCPSLINGFVQVGEKAHWLVKMARYCCQRPWEQLLLSFFEGWEEKLLPLTVGGKELPPITLERPAHHRGYLARGSDVIWCQSWIWRNRNCSSCAFSDNSPESQNDPECFKQPIGNIISWLAWFQLDPILRLFSLASIQWRILKRKAPLSLPCA